MDPQSISEMRPILFWIMIILLAAWIGLYI